MQAAHPFQQKLAHIQNDSTSQFMVIHSDDTEQVESLSVMFPKLTSLIKSNENKTFVINFRDQQQRSLIVMVVPRTQVPIAS